MTSSRKLGCNIYILSGGDLRHAIMNLQFQYCRNEVEELRHGFNQHFKEIANTISDMLANDIDNDEITKNIVNIPINPITNGISNNIANNLLTI